MKQSYNLRQALKAASEVASNYNHEFVGTEHLLLGLMQTPCNAGRELSRRFNITGLAVRQEMDKLVQVGPSEVGEGKKPLTPRAKKVLMLAKKAASGQKLIRCEHLLLGLMREEEGVAYQVLYNFGLTKEKAVDLVDSLLRKKVKGEVRHTDVFVIAREYDRGGGFDWYPKKQYADDAWVNEVQRADKFVKDNWTAYRFTYTPVAITDEEITAEIDANLDELEKTAERYPDKRPDDFGLVSFPIHHSPWTTEHDRLSKLEGWALLDTGKEISIQLPEEVSEELGEQINELASDGAALQLVVEKALAGSTLHALALFLDGTSPPWSVPKNLLKINTLPIPEADDPVCYVLKDMHGESFVTGYIKDVLMGDRFAIETENGVYVEAPQAVVTLVKKVWRDTLKPVVEKPNE